jgi:hypothetical protein
MATTGLYKTLTSSDAQMTEPGFLNAWISLLSDFTTLQQPVLSTPQVIGEAYTIDSNHVWIAGKEAIGAYLKQESLEAPAESNGEKGSLAIIHHPKLYIVGDGPNILEVINNLKNERLIVFMQNECGANAKFLQFGSGKCDYAQIEKIQKYSGTKLGGQTVGWELTMGAFGCYYYNGTISERA